MKIRSRRLVTSLIVLATLSTVGAVVAPIDGPVVTLGGRQWCCT